MAKNQPSNQGKQTTGKQRTSIGSMKLENDSVGSSIGNMIPERWRDPIAIVLLFVSLLVFFRGVLDKDHVFHAGDNVASDSFRPFLDKAQAAGTNNPQWIPNIFCGMPAFAGLVVTGDRTYDIAHTLFDVIRAIPKSLFGNPDAMTQIWHYFILGLGMYLFMRVTRNTSRVVAFFAGFSAIFSAWIITYVMIGHNTKIFAIMTMPYIFMSIEKLRTPNMRWQSAVFWCSILAIAFHFLLESTHMQMVFYIFLSVLLYFVVSLVWELIFKNHIGSLIRAGVLALVMVGLAFAMSADRYMASLAYEPYSIRGQPPIVDTKAGDPAAPKHVGSNNATTEGGGLDWTYATNWSFSPAEVITFIIPGYFGYGVVPIDLPSVPEGTHYETYWGQAPNTDAANYTGIVVLLLGIIAILTLWKRDRIVLPFAVISIFAVVLSFGGNFPLLYRPMFDYFPKFNIFRAPMMGLVLMQLCFPILAALAFEEILRVWKIRNDREDQRLQKVFKYALYVTGALAVAFIVGRGIIVSNVEDGIRKSGKGPSQYPELVSLASSMAANDAAICMIIAVIASGLVYMFLRRKSVTPMILSGGLLLLCIIDLWRVDPRRMEIIQRDDYQKSFQKHDYIEAIKQDTNFYRVMDMNDPVSNVPVSYGLQTPAGYHAAKMRRFQDVVDITGNMNGNGIYNPFMWNLLNTKYIIANGGLSNDQSRFNPVFQSAEQPADPKGQHTIVWQNPQTLPRVFFAHRYEVKPKLDILHAMRDGSFNPQDVIYFDEEPKGMPALTPGPMDFTQEFVRIGYYKNEEIEIKTKTDGTRMFFMSDVWYPDWTATIDGKPTPIYRANYAFRAVVVPPGRHTVLMKYEDPKYESGMTISLTANVIVMLGLLVGLSSAYFIRKGKKPEVEAMPAPEEG